MTSATESQDPPRASEHDVSDSGAASANGSTTKLEPSDDQSDAAQESSGSKVIKRTVVKKTGPTTAPTASSAKRASTTSAKPSTSSLAKSTAPGVRSAGSGSTLGKPPTRAAATVTHRTRPSTSSTDDKAKSVLSSGDERKGSVSAASTRRGSIESSASRPSRLSSTAERLSSVNRPSHARTPTSGSISSSPPARASVTTSSRNAASTLSSARSSTLQSKPARASVGPAAKATPTASKRPVSIATSDGIDGLKLKDLQAKLSDSESKVSELQIKYDEAVADLEKSRTEHTSELSAALESLRSEHAEAIAKVNEVHDAMIEELNEKTDERVKDKSEHLAQEIRKEQAEEIVKLTDSHGAMAKQLQEQLSQMKEDNEALVAKSAKDLEDARSEAVVAGDNKLAQMLENKESENMAILVGLRKELEEERERSAKLAGQIDASRQEAEARLEAEKAGQEERARLSEENVTALSDLQAQLAAEKTNVEQLTRQITLLEEKATGDSSETENRIKAALEQAKETHDAIIVELQSKLDQEAAVSQTLKEEINSLKEKSADTSATDAMEQEMKMAQQDMQAKVAELGTLKTELEELRSKKGEVDETVSQMEKLQEELKMLKEAKEEASTKVAAMEAMSREIEDLRRGNEEASQKASAMEKAKEDMEKLLKEKESSEDLAVIEDLRAKLKALHKEKEAQDAKAEANMKKTTDTIKTLNEQLDASQEDKNRSVSELQSQFSESMAKWENIQKEFELAKSARDEALQINSTFQATIQRLETDFAAIGSSSNEESLIIQEQLKTKEAELEASKQNAKELQDKVTKLGAQHQQEMQKKIDELASKHQEELNNVRAANDEAIAQLSKGSSEEVQEQISELTKQKGEASKKIEELTTLLSQKEEQWSKEHLSLTESHANAMKELDEKIANTEKAISAASDAHEEGISSLQKEHAAVVEKLIQENKQTIEKMSHEGNEDLQRQIKAFHEQLGTATQARDEMSSKLQDLEKEKASLAETHAANLKSLEEQLKAAEQAVLDMSKKSEASSLGEDSAVQQLQENIKTLEDDLSRVNGKYSTTAEALEQAKSEIVGLKKALDAIEKQQKANSEHDQSIIAQLKGEIITTKAQGDRAHDELIKLHNSEMQHLQNEQAKSLKKVQDRLAKETSKAAENKDRYDSDLEALKSKHSGLLLTKNEELHRTWDMYETASKEVDALKKSHELARSEIEEKHKTALDEKTTEHAADLEKTIASFEEKLKALQHEHETVLKEKLGSAEAHTAELMTLQESKSAIKDHFETQSREHQLQQKAYQSLQAEFEAYRKMNDERFNEVQAKDDAIAEGERVIAELAQRNMDLTNQIADETDDKNKAARQIRELKFELNEARLSMMKPAKPVNSDPNNTSQNKDAVPTSNRPGSTMSATSPTTLVDEGASATSNTHEREANGTSLEGRASSRESEDMSMLESQSQAEDTTASVDGKLASLNEQVHQLKTTNEDSIEYNQSILDKISNFIPFSQSSRSSSRRESASTLVPKGQAEGTVP